MEDTLKGVQSYFVDKTSTNMYIEKNKAVVILLGTWFSNSGNRGYIIRNFG